MGDFVLSCGGWVAEEHELHYALYIYGGYSHERRSKKGQGRIECARKSI